MSCGGFRGRAASAHRLGVVADPDAAILRFIGGCVPTVEARPVWVLYTCLMVSETSKLDPDVYRFCSALTSHS